MTQITITPEAREHFLTLLKDQPEHTQIRIFVLNPGTANAECGVSYCPIDSIEPDDTPFEYDRLIAYVDQMSLSFLDEAVVDYVTEEMGTQLTLKAPNAKLKKVADDASLIERVNYVIQTQINPNLAGHGGSVSVVEITDEGVAILQFGGGCNGCSMVDVTLQEGIEKELLAQFSGELTAVRDITKHASGEHSYYK